MSENKMEILKPFGPSIVKIGLPKEMIETLNNFVDQVIIDEKRLKELDNGKNLAGNVKQEFKLEIDLVKSSGFLNFLANATSKWIERTEHKKLTNFNLISSWIVRQFENEYNPVHSHGGHISGVGYLLLPKDYGKTFQITKRKNFNGNLSLIHGNKMFNSASVHNIVPKVGDFYLFPNYLMHTVYPFYGDDERRSVSFNATIDENIYNVASK
tara:strand:+ start:258 stop:893 length:636 start_codon:yes stop_codon:yes gene_type:complete